MIMSLSGVVLVRSKIETIVHIEDMSPMWVGKSTSQTVDEKFEEKRTDKSEYPN